MRTNFPVINLLRGFAVIMVCLYHFAHFQTADGPLFEAGHWMLKFTSMGEDWVYVFFLISGFVIPLSLDAGNYSIGKFHKFLGRRMVRIEIPYLFSIALILILTYFFSIKNGVDFNFQPIQLLLHIFFLVPISEFQWYNVIYWTLAIEIQFYILMGIIQPIITGKNIMLSALLLTLICASVFLVSDNRILFYYSPLFCVGILLYLIMSKKIHFNLGIILMLIFIVVIYQTFNFDVTIVMIISMSAIVGINIDWAWINRLGDFSYSLYLTHGLIGVNFIYLVSEIEMSDFHKILLCVIALIFSIAFAFIFWKSVENPSASLSRKISIKN